jgi:hypothetical protein
MELSDLIIRLATEQDLDTLTHICRLCFPDMLRWRAPKSHSRKWWRLLINSDYCEIWICMYQDKAIGYVELDLDKTQSKYCHAWERHNPSLFVKLYLLAFCPKLFITKALQKLKQRSLEKQENLKSSSSKEGDMGMLKQPNKPIENMVCWIRRIAVVPDMQGKGVSLEINKHCFQRAKKLEYKELYAFVERKNIRSRVMVAILGYEIDKERDDAIFFRKSI